MVDSSVGIAAGLAGWALTPLAFALQTRLLRLTPGLQLRIEPRSVVSLAARAFLLQAGATTLLALLLDAPLVVAALALVFGAWLAARRTLCVDLLRVGRVVRLLEGGRAERGVRESVAIVRSCRRHGFGLVLGHIAQALAKTVELVVGPEAALRVLEPIAERSFVVDQLDWLLVLQRVTLLVAVGRCEDARRCLRDCERRWEPPTEALGETRDVMIARTDAATGAHAAALERAADRAGISWDLVRAHAHAASGDGSKARAALEQVRAAEHGPEVLALVAARSGPAAKIAQAMLSGDGPYRA